jgi:hypothetical protein
MSAGYSPEEKAGILKQHFVERRSLSAVCEEYGIEPKVFRKWKDVLFENSAFVFRQFPQDGTDYFQNYDFVVNWFSEIFRGKTLGVLGVKTGEIRRVCSFKPSEISVSAGIMDVIFEDTAAKAYHLEEQRDMTEDDFYRFASQHFSAAREWKDSITDIILVSGSPYAGKKEIRTASGTYAPLIVDLTERDGPERLEKIREAADKGDLSLLPELVFLPLYGKEKGEKQVRFVKKVIRYETELYRQEKMPVPLIAATLIMANKLIDKAAFHELWEEVKMLNILKFAHEKGAEEGEEKGRKEGKEEGLQTAREMVIETLQESLGIVPGYIADGVRSLSHPDVKGLLRQAFRCKEISEFEKMLRLATKQAAS